MYYEECVIDGRLCWRGVSDGEWTPFTLESMTVAYRSLMRMNEELRRHLAEDETRLSRIRRELDETPTTVVSDMLGGP